MNHIVLDIDLQDVCVKDEWGVNHNVWFFVSNERPKLEDEAKLHSVAKICIV